MNHQVSILCVLSVIQSDRGRDRTGAECSSKQRHGPEPKSWPSNCSVLTHQGSRNMVAKLNPNITHMVTKTGRLLGTQAMIVTAGMKSYK